MGRSLSLPLLTIFTSLLLSGCETTRSSKQTQQSQQIDNGIWVVQSARFPMRSLEVVIETSDKPAAFRSMQLRRMGKGLRRNEEPRVIRWITESFEVRSNEGNALVYEAIYTLDRDSVTFFRQPKGRTDPYVNLRLKIEEHRLIVDTSDDRMVRGFNGNFFEPLEEDAFFDAIRENDIITVKALKDDAEFSRKPTNPLGRTALFVAAANGSVEVVNYLIEAGVDVNSSNETEFGRNALAAAVTRSEIQILEMLLEAGANPNFQDNQGNTPLHIAGNGCGKYRAAVSTLLKAGANPTIKNNRGLTPLEDMKRRSPGSFYLILKEEIERSHGTQGL
jgi:hypothetical protein